MKKGLFIAINVVLVAIVCLLGWQVVKSIKAPINFKEEVDTRETEVRERLVDIRTAELLYKNAYNKYTADLDSLIYFCQHDSIPNVKMISKQNAEDSTYYTDYDTIGYIRIIDTIMKGNVERNIRADEKHENWTPEDWKNFYSNYNISDLKWVPYSEPKQPFEIEADIHDNPNTGIKVPVFEARSPYDVYLAKPGKSFSEKDWKQRVDNLKAEKVGKANVKSDGTPDEDDPRYRYPGLKIGSLKEASVEGNWQKL